MSTHASVTELTTPSRRAPDRVRPHGLSEHRGFPEHAGRFLTALLLALAAVLVSTGAAHAVSAPAAGNPCGNGGFCAWPDAEQRGEPHRVDLRTAPMEQCVALPKGLEAQSFANHTGHPVTVYQDPQCDSSAEFRTFRTDTFVPRSPYVARAIKIWSH